MAAVGDLYANEPICNEAWPPPPVAYLGASLATKPTDPEIMAEWDRRSRGEDTAAVPGRHRRNRLIRLGIGAFPRGASGCTIGGSPSSGEQERKNLKKETCNRETWKRKDLERET